MNFFLYIRLYVSTYILLNVHKAWTIKAPSDSDPGSSISTGHLGNDPSRTNTPTNVPASTSTPGLWQRAHSSISNIFSGIKTYTQSETTLGPLQLTGEKQTLHKPNGGAVDALKFRESTLSTPKHILSLERSITDAEDKLNSLGLEKDEKENDMKDAQKNILNKGMIKETFAIKEQLKKLRSKSNEYTAEGFHLEQELEELNNPQPISDDENHEEIKIKLEEINKDITKCKKDIQMKNDLIVSLNLKSNQSNEQNNQGAQAQETPQQIQDDIALAKIELKNLEEELAEKSQEKEQLDNNINDINTNANNDITSQINDKKEEIDRLRSDHEALQIRIESLESQMHELNAEVIPNDILKLYQNFKASKEKIEFQKSLLKDNEKHLEELKKKNGELKTNNNDPNLTANSEAIEQFKNLIKEKKNELDGLIEESKQLNIEYSSAIDEHNVKAREDYINSLKDFEDITTDYIDVQKKLAKYQEELIEVFKNSKPQELKQIQDMITRNNSDKTNTEKNNESIKNLKKSKDELKEKYEKFLKFKNEEISKIKENLLEAQTNFTKSENEKTEIQENLKTVQNDLDVIKRKRDEDLVQLNTEIEQAHNKCQAQENTLATLNEEIEVLKKNYEAENDTANKKKIEETLKEYENHLKLATEVLLMGSAEYTKLKDKKEMIEKSSETKITDLNNQIKDITKEFDLNVIKLNEARKEKEKLNNALNESNTKLSKVIEEHNNAKKNGEDLANLNKTLGEQLTNANAKAVEGEKYFTELTKLRIRQTLINDELAQQKRQNMEKDIEIERLNEAINKDAQEIINKTTSYNLLKNRIKQFKRKFQQIIKNINQKHLNASKVLDIFSKNFDKNDLNTDSDSSDSSSSDSDSSDSSTTNTNIMFTSDDEASLKAKIAEKQTYFDKTGISAIISDDHDKISNLNSQIDEALADNNVANFNDKAKDILETIKKEFPVFYATITNEHV